MSKLHIPVCPITITANGDLPPNRFIGTDSAVAGAAANTLGVSTNFAADGEHATIEILGVISVETGAGGDSGCLS